MLCNLVPRAAEDRVGGYWEGEARAGNASPIMVFIGVVLGKRRALRTKTSRNIAEGILFSSRTLQTDSSWLRDRAFNTPALKQ